MNLYKTLLRPLLFSLDPENAHELILELLKWGVPLASSNRKLTNLLEGKIPSSPSEVAGISFKHPIGLAAGMDKNGIALPLWEAFGFAFVEMGTVTAYPQPGNPSPRLFRYPEQEALINRLGFNNKGAEKVAAGLTQLRDAGYWPSIPIGINIGKSKVTPLEDAWQDYRRSARLLRDFGDYFVINVSSPNTPGLRLLQSREQLAKIIDAVRSLGGVGDLPLFVKIAPDLAEKDLFEIVRLAEEENLAGLIATNTTLDHAAIPNERDQIGGLSGAPLRHKSLAILKQVRSQTKLPIIASGGICDRESFQERIKAGASLIQVYTAFIYQGPRLIRELLCRQD